MFKLKLLNDAERWKADQKQLAELLGQEAWPCTELARAAKEEETARRRQVQEALAHQRVLILHALAAGDAASTVLARLRPRTFVFDFQVSPPGQDGGLQGGMKQKLVALRDTVTFILACASPQDSVVLRLRSPGGGVTDYGLAASQLLRFRKAEIPLTVCIDNVAASGGYMMASTANAIVAAPFAFVGSIGVIATVPNFSKLLKRADVDYLQFTAGRWKRTVDPFTPPTEEGIEKMREDVDKIHQAFKGHVAESRDVDIEGVATGEVFMGVEAVGRGLVDRLATSDEVLAAQMQHTDVVEVSLAPAKKKGLLQLLEGRLAAAEATARRLLGPFMHRGGEGCVSLECADPRVRGG
ncbi:unnamed protein product [Prorocentrum cordatum]|uniref:Peptidase S49 domain-containing protein n=1 Tax=Prorocentrum cordatum TaxID=2364126 RepID=A0ABN9R1A1_9DINO|nr:unnamed protein product [Polarella glacialis]